MANEGQRYRNLTHTIAVKIHDDIANGKKVDVVKEDLHYFFREACIILLGGVLKDSDGKNLS